MKSKLFSLINVGGMAISIASVLLIALFIHDEYRFDRHIADHTQKYRLYTEAASEDGSVRKRSMVPPAVAPAAASAFGEIESYTRFLNFNFPILFTVGDKKLSESKGGYIDATVFDMFSLKLLEGDRNTALKEPNTIAISQSLRTKYFSDRPALGELIMVNDQTQKVVAVFEDFSSHSHLQLDYLLSMEEFNNGEAERMQRWTWHQFHTYVRLRENTDVTTLEKKLDDLVVAHTPDERSKFTPRLMRIDKVHLHAYDHLWDIAVRGSIQTIYILLGTALFLILIAVLNFVNLSTARAVHRVREVGIRKVIGALRVHLVNQFVSESVIIVIAASLVGVGLAAIALPLLNTFTGKSIPLYIFTEPTLLIGMAGFTLFVGIAAGVYPAFYISGHKPAQILYGKSSGHSGKALVRKGLVVVQFVLSFFLIIASSVVSDQHTYMRTAGMGFDKDNLLIVQLRGDMKQNLEATRESFLNHPAIKSGTMGYGLPGEAFAGDVIINRITNEKMNISMLTVDHDYVKTLGLEVIAGRDLSRDFPSDEHDGFLITERAAQMLGHNNPEDAIGHPVAWDRWDAPGSHKEGRIVGVLKDIQLNSMRETVNPVILHVYPFAYNTFTLKTEGDDVPSIIAHLEKTWRSFNTGWPFEYRFLDDNFDRMYKSEEKLAVLFKWFTTFAIIVACLGLFGLVVYTTSQKYKEIGIRKVLGAKEVNIVVQLARNYLLLIGIAFVIAIPVSYYAANGWLQNFAFRISLTPLLFIRAGLTIMIVSLLTVVIQSMKAARGNPVHALKEQ